VSGPRVQPLAAPDGAVAALDAGVVAPLAELSVFRVLLRHPRLARSFQELLLSMLVSPRIAPRLRELVIMRIGWCSGSVYEWTQHWSIARDVGVPEADLLALRGDWQSHPGFGPADRAVLAATDEVLATGGVRDSTWAACEAALAGPAERIELVCAIGTWRMIATVLETLRVPLEDGVDPWPPDGRGPEA